MMVIANSREQAQTLRNAVMNEFAVLRPTVWVYDHGNKFPIDVGDSWGAALPKAEAERVQTFLMQKVAELVPAKGN